MSPTRRAALCLALASLPAAAAQGAPPDPFAAGLRFAAGPPDAAPWMPRAVAFAAEGELILAGLALEHPRVALYASAALAGGEALLFEGPALAGAIGVVPVAAGRGPDELFAAAQFPSPDASHRRTEIARYDALAAAQGQGFAPVWTRTLPVLGNGPALLATGAEAGLCVAVHDPGPGLVRLERLDPWTGALLCADLLAGGALSALELSATGEVAALVAGTELWVVGGDGAVLHHETLPQATGCLALAASGDALAVGGFAGLRVLVRDGAGAFVPAATIPSAPGEIAARAALASDGSAVAAGFWSFAGGQGVRVVWRDVGPDPDPTELAFPGSSALQNFPQALALSGGGERLALALWGQGGPEPEVVLLERGAPEPLLAWSLPGSALALALAPDGTRVAVCGKDAHANQFATTGAVCLLDTGERDLQLTAPARIGGTLAASMLAPGATQAVFALGTPAPAPLAAGGVGGALLLQPGGPLLLAPRPVDAAGRAHLALPIPPAPALIGAGIGLQGASVGPQGAAFTAARALPAVL